MRQIVLAAGAVALLTACGGSTSPTPTPIAPTPTTPSVPTVARITITGNVPLTQIGQTVQLTAIAALSDNSTKDVTSESNWQWGDARVATVSPRGLVTIVGFGATLISANYQSRGASVTVTATLPDTFVISGRVREPAAGGIANVRVVDTLSGRSGMTDKNGHFSLAELTRLQAHVKAEKDGYEPAELDAIQTNVDLPIQQIVRLTAGETVRPSPLAPNDLAYDVGATGCSPCRLIRVVVPRAGALRVRVTWTLVTSKLSLFAGGQQVAGGSGELTADLSIDAPKEVLIYLGATTTYAVTEHTPFTVETSVR